uniref:Cation transporter n=1 Tax=Thermofilum pendens TaxID=2269 RepID=A0A7C3WU38_THEPE
MYERSLVRRVFLFSALANAAVAALKIAGGLLSGSIALLADGSDSVLNVASATIAYKLAGEAVKPPDEQHPYGHARLEVYASMVILLLMAITFSFVLFQALDRVSHGVYEKIDPVGVVFAVASLALNLVVSSLLRVWGTGSPVAVTEARHVTLDVAEGLITLVGVSLGAYVSFVFDLTATAVIMALVAYFMVETTRELKHLVLDTSPPPEVMRRIEDVLRSSEKVLGYHDLRARAVQGKIYADVHLEMDSSLTLEEVHQVCDAVENRLREELGDVEITIHVEPVRKGERRDF